MSVLKVDFNNLYGKIRPMHATNNGPVKSDAFGANLLDGYGTWRAAGIPYARTHDSSFSEAYGGEHTIDVHAIFPDFDADVNAEQSYDFAITDEYLKSIIECGTKVFYRLGTKIEHEVKKYNTLPPKDFQKWAEICEHIIMHYTEGWADGFRYEIEYWEIWNEPDLESDDAERKCTWGGTLDDFCRFYEIAATHLKSRFPHLKIGGPASASIKDRVEKFLSYISGKNIPLDFFSWHCYGATTEKFYDLAAFMRAKLDEYGFVETESILNEWNYIKSWDEFIYSVKQIISLKGAAFTAACMCGFQNDTSVDMLMYYDARPSKFNGLFDYYTNEPLKGYYPFKMFDVLYRMGEACKCEKEDSDIYAAAAKCGDESSVMISRYTDDDSCIGIKKLKLEILGGAKCYEMFVLDEAKNAESVGLVAADAVLEMKPNMVVLLRSVK